ncbi:hypothetical protein [Herbaspirillum aquaticum]|uniref:Uncharacterized protein n=1 Tax=Herbaspirillum aquaticum TaxID=568783 RepID=A0A225SVU1_9BURK|nr:hypothetical protein [Herbaspirillum aquaticum]OWY35271.1 hypothetical protein CEJ45_08335 [Herbaspirillum aquaticum]
MNNVDENLKQAVRTCIDASDCAVGMLNSLDSLFAGIQALADNHRNIQQLAMLGQEVIDGYMETMRSYKENLPALTDGGAK